MTGLRGSVLVLAMSCSGWIGDEGFCPDFPPEELPIERVIPRFGVAPEAQPVFEVSPLQTALAYADESGSTGLVMTLTPTEAELRAVPGVVYEGRFSPDEIPDFCRRVATSFTFEVGTDDGTLSFVGKGEAANWMPATQLTASVPFEANRGDLGERYDAWAAAFVDRYRVAPQSVQPVAYRVDLDVDSRVPSGRIAVVVTHDPVRDEVRGTRTSTDWVIGTFGTASSPR